MKRIQSSYNISIRSRQGLNPFLELSINLRLRSTSSHQQIGLLHQTTHHTQSIMQRTLGLIQHELVGTTEKQRHRLTRVGNTRNLGDLTAFHVHLFDQVGMTKFISREGIDMSNRSASQSLVYERIINQSFIQSLTIINHH